MKTIILHHILDGEEEQLLVDTFIHLSGVFSIDVEINWAEKTIKAWGKDSAINKIKNVLREECAVLVGEGFWER